MEAQVEALLDEVEDLCEKFCSNRDFDEALFYDLTGKIQLCVDSLEELIKTDESALRLFSAVQN